MSRNSKLPNGFSIVRLEHDTTGEDYAKITFPRTDGRSDGETCDTLANTMNPNFLKKALQNGGAAIPAACDCLSLANDLILNLPAEVGRLSSSPGWKGDFPNRVFILPERVFGDQNIQTVLMHNVLSESQAVCVAGNLKKWKQMVATPAVASNFIATAILTSLAAPLLVHSELREGFILNFAGNGSTGKTTANLCAASVWGDPTRSPNWNATSRGLTEIASSHNDLCLILDDIERADENIKKRVGRLQEMTHVLTSGKGRKYSKLVSTQDKLPDLSARCTVLSSSPETVERNCRRIGSSRTDGDRARLLELQVPSTDRGGIWANQESLEQAASTSTRSDEIAIAAKTQFGHAGYDWLEYLVKNQRDLPTKIRKYTTTFLERTAPKANGVEKRIATKIGLLFAAGQLGRKAGILPWSKKQLQGITAFAYEAILEAGFCKKYDPQRALKILRSAIKDQNRFSKIKNVKLTTVEIHRDAEGFIHRPSKKIYIRNKAFQKIVSESLSGHKPTPTESNMFYDYLQSKNMLIPGHSGGRTQDVRIGQAKCKFLVFDGAILCP